MPPSPSTIFEYRPGIGSRSSRGSGRVNIAFGSTISGGSASSGGTATRIRSRSSTTTEEGTMASKKLAPVHPGEVLLEEFLGPLGLSQYRLSREINVPPRRINEIVHRKRAITADTALRLARFFSTSERFWL